MFGLVEIWWYIEHSKDKFDDVLSSESPLQFRAPMTIVKLEQCKKNKQGKERDSHRLGLAAELNLMRKERKGLQAIFAIATSQPIRAEWAERDTGKKQKKNRGGRETSGGYA